MFTKSLIVIFGLLITLTTHAQCSVKDDTGSIITLTKPATRVISLAPDITEDLYAIDAAKNLIAVISGSDYPSAARKLPVIGSYTGLDMEAIVRLRPDLIVAWGSAFTRQVQALRRMKIPVYVITPVYLQDIPRTLRNLGCLTGHTRAADAAAARFTQQLDHLRAQYQHAKPTRVFYQIGSYSLLTINHKSWINQAIEVCGGRNSFADAPVITPEVSWEAVLAANPEVILTDSRDPNWKARWLKWHSIAAVAHHRLYAINPDWIDRASPRLLLGIERACKFVQNPPI